VLEQLDTAPTAGVHLAVAAWQGWAAHSRQPRTCTTGLPVQRKASLHGHALLPTCRAPGEGPTLQVNPLRFTPTHGADGAQLCGPANKGARGPGCCRSSRFLLGPQAARPHPAACLLLHRLASVLLHCCRLQHTWVLVTHSHASGATNTALPALVTRYAAPVAIPETLAGTAQAGQGQTQHPANSCTH
jgi:hypothetical protein